MTTRKHSIPVGRRMQLGSVAAAAPPETPAPLRERKARSQSVLPEARFHLGKTGAGAEFRILRTDGGPKDAFAGARFSDRTVDDGSVGFNDVPAGPYALLVRVPGYRPFATILAIEADRHEYEVSMPWIPLEHPEQGNELLRAEEQHPFVATVRAFLTRYGYLQEACECEPLGLCEHVVTALTRFQHRYRLPLRAALTIEAFDLMTQPRCPHPDVRRSAATDPADGVSGRDPFTFSSSGRWDSTSLSYKLGQNTKDISNAWSLVNWSFGLWEAVTPLQCRPTEDSQPDIGIGFKKPGDIDYPFGTGLCHSKYAQTLDYHLGRRYADIVFDDWWDWNFVDLRDKAGHEIGHALGLEHSGVAGSIMTPNELPWESTTKLHEVDIRAIKSLYPRVIVAENERFVAVPLFAIQAFGGTDTVLVDLGSKKRFLAWGTINVIDSLDKYDRDNAHFIDIFEIDGQRTGSRIYGGDHWGSASAPCNAFEGAHAGEGQRLLFRLGAVHGDDLEVAGYAIVLVLD